MWLVSAMLIEESRGKVIVEREEMSRGLQKEIENGKVILAPKWLHCLGGLATFLVFWYIFPFA